MWVSGGGEVVFKKRPETIGIRESEIEIVSTERTESVSEGHIEGLCD